jgi:hypothetical protein
MNEEIERNTQRIAAKELFDMDRKSGEERNIEEMTISIIEGNDKCKLAAKSTGITNRGKEGEEEDTNDLSTKGTNESVVGINNNKMAAKPDEEVNE